MELGSTTSRSPQAASVQLKIVKENLDVVQEFPEQLEVKLSSDKVQGKCTVQFLDASGKEVFVAQIKDYSHIYQAGTNVVFIRVVQGSAVVTFPSQNATSQLLSEVYSVVCPDQKKPGPQSVFSLQIDDSSAKQYFHFYGLLSKQQNMLQDFLRTSTYQSAMLQNGADFRDKVVLDVGAGSGILSFFAVQAGARKVYAVEASNIALHCQQLVHSNKFTDKIIVVAGKIEEVDIPEPIDVIISEPMGYMLFNERMLESFLFAKKWLKPEGHVYPTEGVLYCSPFKDEALYMEQYNKAFFWHQQHFYGVDLSILEESAMEEYFKQPVVDTFDVNVLMAKPVSHTTNFKTASNDSLLNITFPVTFKVWSSGLVHGLAFWFDVSFIGSESTVWLSTAPSEPLTHWYQVRCLLRTPLSVHSGQEINGIVVLKVHTRQSYDVDIQLKVTGTTQSVQGSYDLGDPYFRYTGLSATPPPGSHHSSPTETWAASAPDSNNASKTHVPSSYKITPHVRSAAFPFASIPLPYQQQKQPRPASLQPGQNDYQHNQSPNGTLDPTATASIK